MSTVKWSIRGIGVKQSDFYEYLDAEKIVAVLKNRDDFTNDEMFRHANNQERMEMLEYLEVDETDYFCSVLANADQSGNLTSSNNDRGDYYLIYEPHFPWEKKGFENAEAARMYIAKYIHGFTLANSVSIIELFLLIDKLDEYFEAN